MTNGFSTASRQMGHRDASSEACSDSADRSICSRVVVVAIGGCADGRLRRVRRSGAITTDISSEGDGGVSKSERR